jgi:C4-dicarboxylate-specific signal transduction histidine kinase
LTDLNAIVREACGLVQMRETGGGAELSLELAEGPLTIRVDRIQIQQVIINLVQNGLDSMSETEDAGYCLRVRTARSGEDKVEVAVTDSGDGLADEDLERVFEPFVTTKPEGLGIGLSISRSIVEAHGGHIWARPNPDKGMTFGFKLQSESIELSGATGKNAT